MVLYRSSSNVKGGYILRGDSRKIKGICCSSLLEIGGLLEFLSLFIMGQLLHMILFHSNSGKRREHFFEL